jgi:hypothetical protein
MILLPMTQPSIPSGVKRAVPRIPPVNTTRARRLSSGVTLHSFNALVSLPAVAVDFYSGELSSSGSMLAGLTKTASSVNYGQGATAIIGALNPLVDDVVIRPTDSSFGPCDGGEYAVTTTGRAEVGSTVSSWGAVGTQVGIAQHNMTCQCDVMLCYAQVGAGDGCTNLQFAEFGNTVASPSTMCLATLYNAMPCCAMLCCTMLCYAMPCYAMLCYAMLRYAVTPGGASRHCHAGARL